MKNVAMLALLSVFFFSNKVSALGLDVGPVHIHGTKVKVGNNIDLKIVPEKITKDDDKEKKDQIVRIKAHRKGDSDDTLTIKVEWKDLDDKSKELLKELKEDKIYEARLEKLDDDWKLVKIRKTDEE